jgi:hypothetical protein
MFGINRNSPGNAHPDGQRVRGADTKGSQLVLDFTGHDLVKRAKTPKNWGNWKTPAMNCAAGCNEQQEAPEIQNHLREGENFK